MYFRPLRWIARNKPRILVQGGGFKQFLFSPSLGEMIQFDEHIFQLGWFNHQPVIVQRNIIYPNLFTGKDHLGVLQVLKDDGGSGRCSAMDRRISGRR